MAFKFPSISTKNDMPLFSVRKNISTFRWAEISEERTIGDGSFGMVILAKSRSINPKCFTKKLVFPCQDVLLLEILRLRLLNDMHAVYCVVLFFYFLNILLYEI